MDTFIPDPGYESEISGPFAALCDNFAGKGLNTLRILPQQKLIRFELCTSNAILCFVMSVSLNDEVLQLFVRIPVLVGKEKMRPSVAELLARMNYGMLMGGFEMDLKDGEIRFHITHIIEEGMLGSDAIQRVFVSALGSCERYFPAIMQHLYAGITPEDAVFMAELDYHADHVGPNGTGENDGNIGNGVKNG